MGLDFEFKNAWKFEKDENKIDEVMSFCENYRKFISRAKTERLFVSEIVEIAKQKGFRSIEEVISKGELKSGDKIYSVNRNKAITFFVIGKQDIEKGMRIVGGHIDSPRMDLKPNPVFEGSNLGFLKTHYYGGIKKYQWTTIPLALHGVVFLKSGEKVNINIGDNENDPVFCVTDLLIHLAADQMNKKLKDGVTGEALNVLVGNIPLDKDEKDAVKLNVLKVLNKKYNIEERDFLSAEIEVVPAGNARDLGFDESMILGYGQDDRVCSYSAVEAIFNIGIPEYTSVALCVDKEEVGSMGNTGMQSRFFENDVAELISLQGDYSDIKVRRAMSNTKVLSADVDGGYDPNYADAYEKNNSAIMGNGVVLCKYTGARGKGGCNDANSEFMSEIGRIFDAENVIWQTSELGKVDQGGGGTIAYILANANAEVIDCGIALLNMHAPYEVASKVDIYEMFKAYRAFYRSGK